jgi:hypothetical protein
LDTPATLQPVEILPLKKKAKGELSDKIYYECAFCGKKQPLEGMVRNICERLSGDEFYCNFCLRNHFHTRNNRNVFVCSFRAIIGYYYYNFFLYPFLPNDKIYLSELQDYVTNHVETGLQNPVFYYDPSTYLWFIDFSRVGKGPKKVRLDEVLHTVSNVLACFNLTQHVPKLNVPMFYGKFGQSLEKFHSSRFRPDDSFLCIPTFSNCLDYYFQHKAFTMEDTRWFTPDQLRF